MSRRKQEEPRKKQVQLPLAGAAQGCARSSLTAQGGEVSGVLSLGAPEGGVVNRWVARAERCQLSNQKRQWWEVLPYWRQSWPITSAGGGR